MENFVRNRITELRIKKEISEYQLSYDLGHSRSYINNITSGKTLPSMNEFFSLCDYFEITPEEFFNKEKNDPIAISKIVNELSNMNSQDLELIYSLIVRLKK
ncbi:MAG: helix-turn-helix transcriptional regulator [Lachnospiraceae bacterium]|nr:helix-turn-helix transcriptional regulator [Lachnospiraceae bacterium]